MNAPAPTMHVLAQPSRSTFVTVLAWIMIVLSGLSTYSAVMQFFLFGTLTELPAPDGIDPALPQAAAGAGRGFALVGVAICAFFAYSGYALLRRQNWARRLWIVVFAIGIVANIAFVLVFGLGFSVLFGGLSPAFSAFFVVWAILGVVMALFFGWLTKRLRSPAVRSEFSSSSP